MFRPIHTVHISGAIEELCYLAKFRKNVEGKLVPNHELPV
jgi:hypothetical protein